MLYISPLLYNTLILTLTLTLIIGGCPLIIRGSMSACKEGERASGVVCLSHIVTKPDPGCVVPPRKMIAWPGEFLVV